MASYLQYNGQMPRHALRMSWSNGSKVTLETLFDRFGKSEFEKLDRPFVDWLYNTYIKNLGADFEFVVSQSDLESQEPVMLEPLYEGDEWADEDSELTESVTLESSRLEKAGSMQEATARLRSMRHPDEVGQVETEKTPSMRGKRDADAVKGFPKPGSIVMTGDDLEQNNMSMSTRNKVTSSTYVLTQDGSAEKANPTSKEEREARDRKMASISSGARFLGEEESPGSKSQVLVGNNTEEDFNQQTSKGYATQTVTGAKVNKNYKAYPSEVKIEITAEMISQAPNLQEAELLIEGCKNATTLKVARIQAYDVGNQRLVEKIDRRLRKFPKF